jgi:hypothetical protein
MYTHMDSLALIIFVVDGPLQTLGFLFRYEIQNGGFYSVLCSFQLAKFY